MTINLLNIKRYYDEKICTYGNVSKGVDWKNKESQYLRFQQILKVIENKSEFSIGDIGCGYGELLNYLTKNKYDFFSYFGYDLVDNMILAAQKNIQKTNQEINFHKINSIIDITTCDYLVACGIFNVKLSIEGQDWELYIKNIIKEMFNKCNKGISFNILSTYSDKEFRKDYLYYADPLFIFDFCKKEITDNVSLLHDYGLYEFTIILRK